MTKYEIRYIICFVLGLTMGYIMSLGQISDLKESLQFHVNLETAAEHQYHFDIGNVKIGGK